jgi:hypothetical protein
MSGAATVATLPEWRALEAHYETVKALMLRALFTDNPGTASAVMFSKILKARIRVPKASAVISEDQDVPLPSRTIKVCTERRRAKAGCGLRNCWPISR